MHVAEDILADPILTPWHTEAAKRGYKSSIALPLRLADGTVAALTAYGASSSVWTESERKLMEQIALDLGFGISSLRNEIAKKQYQDDLRESLEQTILVIAGTVDQRDPYTAGHQRRVADLSRRIGEKLLLSEDRIHGLHLGASIHDVGKIGIPAELLAKPGRLSKIELDLIKEHVMLGYELIKDVRFPWPISDIVLQHHERLDGSGYPHGLKEDAIGWSRKLWPWRTWWRPWARIGRIARRWESRSRLKKSKPRAAPCSMPQAWRHACASSAKRDTSFRTDATL